MNYVTVANRFRKMRIVPARVPPCAGSKSLRSHNCAACAGVPA
jgi:hypothetical protein